MPIVTDTDEKMYLAVIIRRHLSFNKAKSLEKVNTSNTSINVISERVALTLFLC